MLPLLLLLFSGTGIPVVLLPLDCDRGGEELAVGMTRQLREVTGSLDGVDCPDCKAMTQILRGEAGEIFRRCGGEKDCRLKIGSLLGARVVITGKVESIEGGILLHLELLDVGSGKPIGKVSRTLSGSDLQRAASLQYMLTEILFPDRMVGALAIALDPAGGDIYLDGDLKTKGAPAELLLRDLSVGQHALRVERTGFNDFFAVVDIPFQGASQIAIKMRKNEPGRSIAVQPASPKTGPKSPWYGRWWFWTIIGAAVVGSTATALVLTQGQ